MSKDQPCFCGFCDKSQFEVRTVIAGPQTFICDECVDVANSDRESDKLARPQVGQCSCGFCDRLNQPVFIKPLGSHELVRLRGEQSQSATTRPIAVICAECIELCVGLLIDNKIMLSVGPNLSYPTVNTISADFEMAATILWRDDIPFADAAKLIKPEGQAALRAVYDVYGAHAAVDHDAVPTRLEIVLANLLIEKETKHLGVTPENNRPRDAALLALKEKPNVPRPS